MGIVTGVFFVVVSFVELFVFPIVVGVLYLGDITLGIFPRGFQMYSSRGFLGVLTSGASLREVTWGFCMWDSSQSWFLAEVPVCVVDVCVLGFLVFVCCVPMGITLGEHVGFMHARSSWDA